MAASHCSDAGSGTAQEPPTEDGVGEVAEADVALAAELRHARDQEGCEEGDRAAGNERHEAAAPAHQREGVRQAQRGHGRHGGRHVEADVVPLACRGAAPTTSGCLL